MPVTWFVLRNGPMLPRQSLQCFNRGSWYSIGDFFVATCFGLMRITYSTVDSCISLFLTEYLLSLALESKRVYLLSFVDSTLCHWFPKADKNAGQYYVNAGIVMTESGLFTLFLCSIDFDSSTYMKALCSWIHPLRNTVHDSHRVAVDSSRVG